MHGQWTTGGIDGVLNESQIEQTPHSSNRDDSGLYQLRAQLGELQSPTVRFSLQ